jgi:hypothetical protein
MSDTTELHLGIDAHVNDAPDNTPPPEVDPQGEVRLSIAEKYEARRLEEIETQREQLGLPPTEPEPTEIPEIVPSGDDPQVVAAEADGAPAIAPVATPAAPVPQQPQLFPVRAPDGAVHYCTVEQIAQLASVGMGAVLHPPQQAPQPAPAPQPTHQPSFDSERAKTIANRLAYGDADDQAKAISELVEAARGPVVNPDQIRQSVKQEVTAEMRLESDLNILGQEFAPIFSNRYATVAAAAAVNDLRANPYWQSRSNLDLYREACRTVLQGFGSGQPQSQPGNQQQPAALQAVPPVTRQARLESKRAAPSIPVATDRRVAMADDTPRPPTGSEVVDQLRKARGQPSLR